jgi:hypothetical protein
MDFLKQVQALEKFHSICSAGFAIPTKTEKFKDNKEGNKAFLTAFEKAHEEKYLLSMKVGKARVDLLKTGYQVPDSWLTVDAIGDVDSGRLKMGKKEYLFVRSYPPEIPQLRKVCDELQAAEMRLRFSPKDHGSSGDKNGDKKKKYIRPLTDEIRACGAAYKRQMKRPDNQISLKSFCREYADEKGLSVSSVYRTLKDHSEVWKVES